MKAERSSAEYLRRRDPTVVTSAAGRRGRRDGSVVAGDDVGHRLELADREGLLDRLGEVARSFGRRHEPTGGTHGEDLDEAETGAGELGLEGPPDELLRLGDRTRVVDSATGDVGDAGQLGQEVGDRDRVAVEVGVAALEAGLGALAEHGG